jgi:Bifunctional DNA primase/polymerase, N-terminal
MLKDLGRCKPGKHPIIKASYPGASNDPRQIMDWWCLRWPWANVGLRTGPDHVALDPDSRNGGDLILRELISEFGPLPETWECRSGSGDTRYIYRLPEGVSLRTGAVKRDDRSLDIISDTGGLIVAGVHKSGNPYTNVWRDIAPLPEVWYEGLLSEGLSPSPLKYLDTRGERAVYDLSLADPESLDDLRWTWQLTGKAFPDEGGVYVLCPSHREDTPSAVVYVSPKARRAKYHCFAGCGSQGAADLFAHLKFNVPLDTPGNAPKDAKGVRLALFEQRMKIHRGTVTRATTRLPRAEGMSDLAWAVEDDFHELLYEF